MTMKLTERGGTVGVFNIRAEHHGDEEKPAIDIPVSAVALSEDELGALLGDAGAAVALYRDGPDGFQVPRFAGLEPLALSAKIEGVHVTMWLGTAKKPLFERACDLKGVKVTLNETGAPTMSCKVQLSEPGDEVVEALAGHLNSHVRVALVPVQDDMVGDGGPVEPAEQGGEADASKAA